MTKAGLRTYVVFARENLQSNVIISRKYSPKDFPNVTEMTGMLFILAELLIAHAYASLRLLKRIFYKYNIAS
jgi:hypothetical protein